MGAMVGRICMNLQGDVRENRLHIWYKFSRCIIPVLYNTMNKNRDSRTVDPVVSHWFFIESNDLLISIIFFH